MALAASRKNILSAALATIAVLCSAVLAYDMLKIQDARSFNEFLAQERIARAAEHDSRNGDFARAYYQHREQDYNQALKSYGRIQEGPDDAHSEAATYNMANIFLQQGIDAQRAGEADVSIPLIELAKQSYRSLLRHNPQDWSARHNLEIALFLQPDYEELKSVVEFNPERSPEAAGAVETHEQLP